MINKHHVLGELQSHRGKANGVSAEALARALHVPTRRIRELVSELREEGSHICAHPKTGYFMAANDAELDRYYIQFLRARALHSLLLISRAKKIALPELLGQMRVKT